MTEGWTANHEELSNLKSLAVETLNGKTLRITRTQETRNFLTIMSGVTRKRLKTSAS
jgi:hypothetical protein